MIAKALIISGLMVSLGIDVIAAPGTPASDEVIVAVLRTDGSSAAYRELGGLRRRLAANPTNLVLALDVARQCLERGRLESDPRFLGQAQVALAPWTGTATPPLDVLVLQATLHQSLHEFDLALIELGKVLARDPRNLQAWLTQATVHTVRGDFIQARQAAAHLLSLADELTATTVVAQIGSLTGQAAAACVQLETVLGRAGNADLQSTDSGIAQRVWATTVWAESLERLGRTDEADHAFRAALGLAPRDPYLLGAYADFLLDQRRAADVIRLLADLARMDGLLLRLAEAHRAAGNHDDARRCVEMLSARFDLARARGDRIHLREEARFELRLRNHPAVALRLALDNWDIQKEPADARLLWEAARATGDRAAESRIDRWLLETKLEDIRYRKMALSRLEQ